MKLISKNDLKTGGYKMETEGNKLVLSFSGFLKAEKMPEFLADYENAKRIMRPASTTLVINTVELKPFPADVEPNLELLYKDYTKFKSIFVINGAKNFLVRNQLTRVWDRAKISDRFKFVDSLADVK